MEKEVIYKVIRWGWDEVKDAVEGMECSSIEFPKFGQWIVNYKTLSSALTHLYDDLAYKEDRYSEKVYSLMTNRFFRLRKFIELIDNRIKDGFKVNYKKPVTYYGGNKKLSNNKG